MRTKKVEPKKPAKKTVQPKKKELKPPKEKKHPRSHYVDILCGVIAECDKGLRRVCDTLRKEDPDFPAARTFRTWFDEDSDEGRLFDAQYARAKAMQVETLVDQIIEISDDDSLDMAFKPDGSPFINSENIQRSKLRVDSRKWVASKLVPKKYGDKIAQEIDIKGAITVTFSPEDDGI